MLRHCLQRSAERELPSLVFSFVPHPRVFFGQEVPPLLEIEEKVELLQYLGFDYVLLQRFDAEFSKLSAEDFAQRVLAHHLKAAEVVVGKNFRFGFKAQGTVDLLKAQNNEVHEVEDLAWEGTKLSSRFIRQWIQNGEVDKAWYAMGYPYFCTGRVQHGEGRGQKLGVPTANFSPTNKLLPKGGVYASCVEDCESGERFLGVTNLGWRPSFESSSFALEVHLIGFQGELYGRKLRHYFFKRLRDERKFNSVDQLVDQIRDDIVQAEKFFQTLQIFQTRPRAMKVSFTQSDPALQHLQLRPVL